MIHTRPKSVVRTILIDLFMVLIAFISASSYIIFIFPNQFAPSGINGLATMIQDAFGFKLGYMSLLVNLPLCAFAVWKLNFTFARRTMIYVIAFSITLFLLEDAPFMQRIAYTGENSAILAPIAAGIVMGAMYGSAIRAGGSTGGTDVIAAIIHYYRPQYSPVWILFIINIVVASLSYFVYDYQLEPVLLCILYSFMSSSVGNFILRGNKSAMKFEIITTHPEELAQEIINTMHHGCTLLEGKGAYTHSEKTVLICVIQKEQVSLMLNILHHFPDTFAYVTQVSETVGNFVHVKDVTRHPATKKEKTLK